MKYTVVWEKEVVDDLAALWLHSADKPAITQAQAKIDFALANNPNSKGYEVSVGLRGLVVAPLKVFFRNL